MPEISRFYGIIISLLYNDHAPPHFHAVYGEHEAGFDIKNLKLISGSMPRRASNLILDWAELHQKELLEAWELARSKKPLEKIEPLQ
jgi:hypothetical protein